MDDRRGFARYLGERDELTDTSLCRRFSHPLCDVMLVRLEDAVGHPLVAPEGIHDEDLRAIIDTLLGGLDEIDWLERMMAVARDADIAAATQADRC